MDELEIGDKRYLSTKRAGKEHKYHSDYIGQLIRAGKVVGKKVGRSWYVEEASLNAYLSGEAEKAAPVIKKTAEVPVPTPEPALAVVAEAEVVLKPEVVAEEKIIEPLPVVTPPPAVVDQKNFNPAPVRRVAIDDGHQIPIKTSNIQVTKQSSLHYIADDAPALPTVQAKKLAITVSEEVPVYESEYLPSVEEVQSNQKIGAFSLATIAVIGIITLSVTAAASVAISFHTTVEEGQVAGAGYTLK